MHKKTVNQYHIGYKAFKIKFLNYFAKAFRKEDFVNKNKTKNSTSSLIITK